MEEDTFTQVTLGDNLKLRENERKVLSHKWNTSEDRIEYTFEALRFMTLWGSFHPS